MMDVIVRMPSGFRLIFDTNASEVSISALAANLVTPPAEKRPVVMDLVTEGKTYTVSSLEGNTIFLNQYNPEDINLVRGDCRASCPAAREPDVNADSAFDAGTCCTQS